MALIGDTQMKSLLTSIIGSFCPVCAILKGNLKNQLTKWPLRKASAYFEAKY